MERFTTIIAEEMAVAAIHRYRRLWISTGKLHSEFNKDSFHQDVVHRRDLSQNQIECLSTLAMEWNKIDSTRCWAQQHETLTSFDKWRRTRFFHVAEKMADNTQKVTRERVCTHARISLMSQAMSQVDERGGKGRELNYTTFKVDQKKPESETLELLVVRWLHTHENDTL